MRSPMWDDILAQAKDGRFRFLKIDENDGDGQRCGLIRYIYSQGENIVFEMIWMGQRPAKGEWTALPETFLYISDKIKVEHGDSGITAFEFRIPEIGFAKVFRNNTIELDPAGIKGLDPLHVRKTRAILYGLREDADWPAIVDRVVKDLGGDGLTSVDEQLAGQGEAERYAA